MNVRTIFLLSAAMLIADAVSAATVAVLPFENLSSTEEAASQVQQRLADVLGKKGWAVAAPEQVEAALAERRIRYVDALDDENRTAVLAEMGASAYISGSVYTFENGRNPVVSFSARMVREDGTVAWGDVIGVAAKDTERLFGFGRAANATEVLETAMGRIAARMPKPGDDGVLLRGPSRPAFLSRPAAWSADDLDPRTPHLVCVLPLQNATLTPEASKIVGDILALRLAAFSGFEVVDPAKLRAAAMSAGLASLTNLDAGLLPKLAPHVGTSLFLRGTIYGYTDATGRSGDPSIQLDLALVDPEAGRVLWASQHERKGSDYEGLLLLGAASNAVLLTDRVVTEMVAAVARKENIDERRTRTRGSVAARRVP